MAVLVLLLAVVIALLAVLVAGLLRSHAEILRALDSLGVGLDPDQPEPRPEGLQVPKHRDSRPGADLVGTTPRGDAVSVSVVGVDRPTLVAFLTSGCSTCAGFWTAFSDLGRLNVPGGARVVVATKGDREESPSRLAKFAPPEVPVVMSSEAWETYDVPVAPVLRARRRAERRRHRRGRGRDLGEPPLDARAGPRRRGHGERAARPSPPRIGRAAGRPRAPRSRARTGRPPALRPRGRPAETRGWARPTVTPLEVTLAGLAVAVVAALRSSWSP